MSLFLETIRIKNGRLKNIESHNLRMNKCRNVHFHEIRDLDLNGAITIPLEFQKGLVKCRVLYDRNIVKVEFEHYIFKNPRTFRLLNADSVDYSFKYADRNNLDNLFKTKGLADDIIMIKDGLLTDSYYANIALYKNRIWYSPKTPLLAGTQRARLIQNEKLVLRDIVVSELFEFEKIKIFNAMIPFSQHAAVIIGKQSILE